MNASSKIINIEIIMAKWRNGGNGEMAAASNNNGNGVIMVASRSGSVMAYLKMA
jgi:hypothetical protein